jgi:hypothetical protein
MRELLRLAPLPFPYARPHYSDRQRRRTLARLL